MIRLAMLAAAGMIASGAAFAQQGQVEVEGAADQVELGVLTCNVSGGVGFVVGSTKSLECVFNAANGDEDYYVGNVSRVGLDIGVTGPSTIVWGVLAPSTAIEPGALAGTYAGVGAQAAVGIGAGANVLVGGSADTFTLQPVSVSGNTGLNIAAGISEIELVSSDWRAPR